MRIFSVTFVCFLICWICSVSAEETSSPWQIAKAKPAKLGKGEYISPVFVRKMITDDMLELPGKKGKGFAIKRSGQKVLVDAKQNGKPKLMALNCGNSKPFDLTLYYEGEKKQKHTFMIEAGRNNILFLVRLSGMQAKIGKSKILLVDENSDGLYGTNGKDAIYEGKRLYGCPVGKIALIGGKLYELKISRGGSQIEYREFSGKTGKIDLFKNWGGKTLPDFVVLKDAKAKAVNHFCIMKNGEIKLPLGDYSIRIAYLPEVIINGGMSERAFVVNEGKTATPVWGVDIALTVSPTWDAKKRLLKIYEKFTVTGPLEERYQGKFRKNPKNSILVYLLDVDGKAVRKPFRWSITKHSVDDAPVFIWGGYESTMPEGTVSVRLEYNIPGVGIATAEIKLED